MTMKIQERLTSRQVRYTKDSEQVTTHWVGYGTDDDIIARENFNFTIPQTFDGISGTLTRSEITPETVGGLLWYATATYIADPSPSVLTLNIPGPDDALDASFSFDFSGVVEHITQSKETRSSTARDGYPNPPANTERAIGVSADGSVGGCDKVSPNFEWSREVTFPYVSMNLLKEWSRLVGSTNLEEFYGWPIASNVFLGGQCTIRDVKRAVVSFKFKANPNVEDLSICDGLVVPIKYGSDYIWVSYANVPDAQELTQQPKAAYVERICDMENWALLGIGG